MTLTFVPCVPSPPFRAPLLLCREKPPAPSLAAEKTRCPNTSPTTMKAMFGHLCHLSAPNTKAFPSSLCTKSSSKFLLPWGKTFPSPLLEDTQVTAPRRCHHHIPPKGSYSRAQRTTSFFS